MKIKKYLLEIFIIMIIVCTFFTHSYALDPQTHKDLNRYIANNTIDGFSLDAYLQEQLGLKAGIEESFNSKQIWKWFRDGGKYEDEPPWTIPYLRSVNHFHNPLEPDIEKAGFTGIWGTGILSGESSILWSQKPVGEQSPGGYYSWHDARGYFYTALTATDKATQDSNFAETFRALGQLMHLVQDISVPAHTRDDGHVMYNYETWVKNNFIKYADLYNYLSIYPPISFDKSAIGNSNSQASVPAANLFDTNQYNGSNPVTTLQSNIGLSEYTNANFLSSDTMFTDDFPFPKAEHCVIVLNTPPNGIPNLDRKYLSSTNGHPGEQINRLAIVSYLDHFRKVYFPNISSEQLPVSLDPACYEDYASKLIPRAVGYSAGLLDYFFRGEMEIKKAYARIGSGLTVSGIDFEVKNITPALDTGQTVEPFESGSLDLSYQYIPDGQDEPVFHLVSEIYTIASADDPINSEDVPVSVTFPAVIPAKAKDLSFTLVFRGKLGNETDAVVGKTLISQNSRIAFCFQPGGDGNEINIYTMLPDGSDVKPITTTSSTTPSDSLYFLCPAWSPDGTMLAFEEDTCTDPDATGENGCRAGYFTEDIVVIDLNSDESYPNNVLTTLHLIDTNDVYLYASSPSFSPDGTKIVALANFYGLYGSLIVFDVNTGAWGHIRELSSDFRMFPAWSPQGDKIAYNLHEESDIYTINPNGTGNTRLTDDLYWNNYPSWSPDGEWIVFLSDRDGEGYRDIWIMDKTGGNMEKVFDCNPDCYQPSFSPEGLRIVFMQSMEIFTMNFNGSDIPHATPGYLDEAWPAWSPFLPPEEP